MSKDVTDAHSQGYAPTLNDLWQGQVRSRWMSTERRVPKVTNLFSRGGSRKARGTLKPLSGTRWKVFKGGASPLFPRETKKQSHDVQCDFAVMHHGIDTFLQCQSSPSCDINMYYATPCKVVILRACTNKVYMHYGSVCILQISARPWKYSGRRISHVLWCQYTRVQTGNAPW